MPRLPEMPEGFPVIPSGKYKAILSKIDDRIITGEGEWEGKMACWWRFKIQGGEQNGNEASENSIMPFYSDGTPVEENLRGKCWRWRDLTKTVYGGVYPQDLDWEDFKQKVSGTEWTIEVATRKFRGVERSEVIAVTKPKEDLPF